MLSYSTDTANSVSRTQAPSKVGPNSGAMTTMQRHSEEIKNSKYVVQAVPVTKFFLTRFTFQWMAGRPGLIGVSVLVLAEEEHL